MGWALAWYKVERQETRKSKSERVVYLTPKSSTTKTKSIGRETCLKRHGVEVSWTPKVEGRETRRRLESFPASLRPYIVIVDAKDNVDLAGGVGFKEGKEIEAGENGGGELMGEEFDVLGTVERGRCQGRSRWDRWSQRRRCRRRQS